MKEFGCHHKPKITFGVCYFHLLNHYIDGIIKDDTRFSLLYEPDNPKNWETDNLVLLQANPVALEVPEIWDDLLKKRAKAAY